MNVELKSNKIVLNKEGAKDQRKIYMGPGIFEARVTMFRDWTKEEEVEATKRAIARGEKEAIPFIKMVIEDETTGAIHEERFYVGPKSHKYSKAKIGHLVAVLCPGCNLADMNTTDLIADGIVGKRARFKLTGEEHMAKNGKVYPRAKSFSLPRLYDGEVHGFCERLDQPQKLTFDFNNPKDFERLSGTSGPTEDMFKGAITEVVAEPPVKDDFPF